MRISLVLEVYVYLGIRCARAKIAVKIEGKSQGKSASAAREDWVGLV